MKSQAELERSWSGAVHGALSEPVSAPAFKVHQGAVAANAAESSKAPELPTAQQCLPDRQLFLFCSNKEGEREALEEKEPRQGKRLAPETLFGLF